VQGLQIQLLVGLGRNKPSRRPLHRLRYGMGISEIILVPPHSQSRWGPERGRSIPFATNFSLEPDVSFRDEAEVGWRQSSLSRSKMTLLGITNKSDFVFARPRPETVIDGLEKFSQAFAPVGPAACRRRVGKRALSSAPTMIAGELYFGKGGVCPCVFSRFISMCGRCLSDAQDDGRFFRNGTANCARRRRPWFVQIHIRYNAR
jgi:hypothetical protein